MYDNEEIVQHHRKIQKNKTLKSTVEKVIALKYLKKSAF